LTAGPAPVLGTVTAFDAHRGTGVVTGVTGRAWTFHATAVADGSRSVEVGTAVAFVVVPGHLGTSEARGLTRVAP
jgi:cold shock CspA family protein